MRADFEAELKLLKTTDDDLRAELEVSFFENTNTCASVVDYWLICNLDCGNRIIGIEKIEPGKTTKIASGGWGLFSIRPFKPVILRSNDFLFTSCDIIETLKRTSKI